MAGISNYQLAHEQDRQRRFQESTEREQQHQRDMDEAKTRQRNMEAEFTQLLETFTQAERRNAELEAQVEIRDQRIVDLRVLREDAEIQLREKEQTIGALEEDRARLSENISELVNQHAASEQIHAIKLDEWRDSDALNQNRILRLQEQVEANNRRMEGFGEHLRSPLYIP